MRLIVLATSLLLVAGAVQAVDISMVGLFPGKAVLSNRPNFAVKVE
jgi:hypothetical protein